MKESYIAAGVPVARHHMVHENGLDDARAFVAQVGYPVIVKPDNGCGAEATYKLKKRCRTGSVLCGTAGYFLYYGRIHQRHHCEL